MEPMGFEPTNPTLTPDDSIGLDSPITSKWPPGSPVLDRNWTELKRKSREASHAKGAGAAPKIHFISVSVHSCKLNSCVPD